MAVYKVPQDVEADDKLLGPFSFRQFIYLIVVAISGIGAYGLSTLFLPLAIVPLPFILFFGALALPLRKDQPMEAYLTAIVSFYFLKSRRRFWEPDGIDSFVTIIAPKNADIKRTKDIDETEAERRFSYLAGIVDSHGWAVRGQDVAAPANLNSEIYREAQQATDVMDGATSVAQGFDRKLQTNSDTRRQQLVTKMQTPPQPGTASATSVTVPPARAAMAPAPRPATTFTPPTLRSTIPGPTAVKPAPVKPTLDTEGVLTSNQRDALAYARGLIEEAEDERAGIPQPVVTPTVVTPAPTPTSASPPPKPDPSTSVTPPSAATIDLATNRPELTVQTISEEAHRIEEKEKKTEDGEVFISLH